MKKSQKNSSRRGCLTINCLYTFELQFVFISTTVSAFLKLFLADVFLDNDSARDYHDWSYISAGVCATSPIIRTWHKTLINHGEIRESHNLWITQNYHSHLSKGTTFKNIPLLSDPVRYLPTLSFLSALDFDIGLTLYIRFSNGNNWLALKFNIKCNIKVRQRPYANQVVLTRWCPTYASKLASGPVDVTGVATDQRGTYNSSISKGWLWQSFEMHTPLINRPIMRIMWPILIIFGWSILFRSGPGMNDSAPDLSKTKPNLTIRPCSSRKFMKMLTP